MKHKIRIKQPNLKDILTKDIFFKNYDQIQHSLSNHRMFTRQYKKVQNI